MLRGLQLIISFFRSVFGQFKFSISWKKPTWLNKIGAKLSKSRMGRFTSNILQKAKGSKYTKPKFLALEAVGIVTLTGLMVIGHGYYKSYLDSLPKPDYIHFNISAPKLTNPETKVVTGFTINFTKSAAKLDQIGKVVTEAVPTIKPAMNGSWKWESDRRLVFNPEDAVAFSNDWLVGTEYSVFLDQAMFPEHLKFSNLKQTFKTKELQISPVGKEFYIHPTNSKIRKATFIVASNGIPFNAEDFKKKISLEINSKESSIIGRAAQTLKPVVSFNQDLTEAYIESPPLDMAGPDRVVILNIEKEVQPVRGGKGSLIAAKSTVDIPGRFSAFTVATPNVVFARNEKFEPEQILVVETGVGVKSEDILKSLQVYLLPEKHDRVRVEGNSTVTIPDVRDWNLSDIRSANFELPSTLLELEPIPTQTPYSKHHSFKIKVPVQRYMYFQLKKGVIALGDYELGVDVQQVIYSPNYSPELMFMSQGAILSLSGDGKLPLLSRNVEKVEFEISKILPQQINFLISRMFSNNSFTHPRHQDIADLISERVVEKQNIPFTSETETQYFSLDLKNHQKKSGFYYVKADVTKAGGPSDAHHRSSYRSHPSDQRLILVTDIGLIAKHTSAQELYVYVQNLRTGKPMTNAQVDILGQNGIPVVTQHTNSQGFTIIPKLDFKKERKPLAIVARNGADVSYLPYQLHSRELAYSRFNTGGTHEVLESEKLRAMLFSDRGLYRPGEEVNIGMILRSQGTNLENYSKLPLTIKVIDPLGNKIKEEKQNLKLHSLQDFKFITEEVSPTGTYTVQLFITKELNNRKYDNLIGTTHVVIEEFQPDLLKIQNQLTPAKTLGWIPLEKLNARISLKNMFGTAAENRLVKGELEMIPTLPRVGKFSDYIFKYSNDNPQTIKESLADSYTNKDGDVEYEIDLSKYQGFFSVHLYAQGYETGSGRSVDASSNVFASNWKSIIGYKADGSMNYIKRNAIRNVNLIALDSDLKPTSEQITLSLNEVKYVSTLTKENDGNYRYKSVKKESLIKESQQTIATSGLKIELPTKSAGDFIYIVKNNEGEEINRFEFKVIGQANLTRTLDRNAELQLVLNKDDFVPGEEIELQILAPYKGSGLITIERENVFAQKWFSTNTNTTVERIRIPENLSGNAYVNVTFLRAIDSSEIYMSPLSYGVQPFSISLDKFKTKIDLQVPEKVRPGEDLTVQYSSNKPTSLILYGVDEGILQVAKYKLPDPLLHFFQKKALQVRTYQLLDLILPEFSIVKDSASAGGDGSAAALQRNLNPFKAKSLKPVVFWSGVLSATSKKQTYTYQVPDYFNGSIKVMAVASSKEGLGSTQTSALSRGDFIITPTSPVFVTPDDEIEVGVNISNQNENSSSPTQLKVKVSSSDHLNITSTKEQTIEVPVGRETGTSFKFKAGREFGVADLKIEVTNGTESAKYSHQLSVRPAVPYMTTITAGMTDSLPLSLDVSREVSPDLASQELALSFLPLSIGEALIKYLSKFPYGCTEQIVSRAIPLLLAKNYDSNMDAAVTHEHVLSILRRRQMTDGGFGLYDGGSATHMPATLYAISYLVEAKKHDLPTPSDMEEKILDFLNSQSIRHFGSIGEVRLFAQALYLRTKYEINPGRDLNYLEELLAKKYKGLWEQDTIAMYLGGIYEMTQQKSKGWRILKNIKMNEKVASNYYFYYDSVIRGGIYLQMITKHYPEHLASLFNNETWAHLLNPLFKGSYNTASAAQVLLAFASLNTSDNKSGFPKGLTVTQTVKNSKENNALSLSQNTVAKGTVDIGATGIKIAGQAPLPLFYSFTQSGFDQMLPTTETKRHIEVFRAIEDKDGNAIKQSKVGEDIFVRLTWRALKESSIPHIVLVDLFPAGFELVRDSVTHNSTAVDYIDKREDRLVVYSEATEGLKQITYRLRATHKGVYNLPAIFAESLYDKDIQYRGVAEKIETL